MIIDLISFRYLKIIIKQSKIFVRRWVQLRTSPAVNVVLYKERVRREQAVSAELSNTAHVYCGDVMCNGNMLSCATGIRIGLGNVIMCGLIHIMICQK